MQTRRQTILTIAAAATLAAAPPLHAQTRPVTIDELRVAFQSRPRQTGQMIQDSLKQSGFDVGAIDGVWGPATARAFEELMASERYRRHAPTWTWSHEVSVDETLFFLTSDAYP